MEGFIYKPVGPLTFFERLLGMCDVYPKNSMQICRVAVEKSRLDDDVLNNLLLQVSISMLCGSSIRELPSYSIHHNTLDLLKMMYKIVTFLMLIGMAAGKNADLVIAYRRKQSLN